MSELSDLYQEVILDHSRRPHNFHAMEGSTHHAEGYNPLCGDQVTVYLKLTDGRISDVSFQGNGCAISKASASVMTDLVKDKTPAEANAIFDQFHKLVTVGAGHRPRPQSDEGQLQEPATMDLDDKMSVFSGVSEFPTRVKCAVLAWHTLRSALKISSKGPVSTE